MTMWRNFTWWSKKRFPANSSKARKRFTERSERFLTSNPKYIAYLDMYFCSIYRTIYVYTYIYIYIESLTFSPMFQAAQSRHANLRQTRNLRLTRRSLMAWTRSKNAQKRTRQPQLWRGNVARGRRRFSVQRAKKNRGFICVIGQILLFVKPCQTKSALRKFMDSMLQKCGKIRALVKELETEYSKSTLMVS